MAIGLSHGGTNVYSSTERSHQLWAGTQDGLVLFEREKSGKWREAQRVAARPAYQLDHLRAHHRRDICRRFLRFGACQRGRRQDLGAAR